MLLSSELAPCARSPGIASDGQQQDDTKMANEGRVAKGSAPEGRGRGSLLEACPQWSRSAAGETWSQSDGGSAAGLHASGIRAPWRPPRSPVGSRAGATTPVAHAHAHALTPTSMAEARSAQPASLEETAAVVRLLLRCEGWWPAPPGAASGAGRWAGRAAAGGSTQDDAETDPAGRPGTRPLP